jgi:CRP/FNR family transcriptional regulator, cyclic AMP receptor protein
MTATGPTTRDVLRAIPLFAALEEHDLRSLVTIATRRTFPPDRDVVREGDTNADLYAVVTGMLRVSVRAQDGRSCALHLLGPGGFFGEISVVDGRARSANVTTLKSSELIVVPRDELLALIDRSPRLAMNLLTAMASLVRRLTTHVQELTAVPVSTRVARKLVEIGDHFGTPINANQLALPPAMSQQDLAEHVQATRESVNKCLAGWMKQGIVQRTKTQLVISDRARLRELARG